MSLTPEEAVRLERMETGLENILDFLELVLPSEFSLSELSDVCGKTRDTLRKYLISNYREDEDYRLTEKGGKIYVARAAALEIRRHYVK